MGLNIELQLLNLVLSNTYYSVAEFELMFCGTIFSTKCYQIAAIVAIGCSVTEFEQTTIFCDPRLTYIMTIIQ